VYIAAAIIRGKDDCVNRLLETLHLGHRVAVASPVNLVVRLPSSSKYWGRLSIDRLRELCYDSEVGKRPGWLPDHAWYTVAAESDFKSPRLLSWEGSQGVIQEQSPSFCRSRGKSPSTQGGLVYSLASTLRRIGGAEVRCYNGRGLSISGRIGVRSAELPVGRVALPELVLRKPGRDVVGPYQTSPNRILLGSETV
jgi:hypothetical protein